MEKNIINLIKPADIITLINALLGFASITMIIRGQMEDALVLILAAVVADAADGAIARYSGYGILGANLDSLADALSFGAAPAAAAVVILGNWGYFAGLFAGLFLICGILRLARFNVVNKKDGFNGIPITAAGFIVALFLLIPDYVPYFELTFAGILVLLSLLMVSTIGYPKLSNPVILAPMALLLVLDIAAFYHGNSQAVKRLSLVLLILLCAYILSPVGRKWYVRNL